MRRADILHLACPSCHGGLRERGDEALACEGCGAVWPMVEGLPHLYREAEVRGNDRMMRAIYDRVPKLLDPAMRYVMPILQKGSERQLRDGYMRRLDLGALRLRAGRAVSVGDTPTPPVRVLEVGIGTGANVALVERDRPAGIDLEIWGVDLSTGLLRECRRKVGREVRLAVADAHALPFRSGSFDRVFHVGGINGFRDARRALAEMARVAAPGTPIVVVDEQLDRQEQRSAAIRAMFRLYTFYNADPRCPVDLLPAGAAGVVEEQLNRFYYCLTFSMPGGKTASGTDTERETRHGIDGG